MNKQRKTSHILNVFQYDADGHVVLPASLTLTVAPASNDNSGKVGTTAWVRSYVTGLSYLTGNQSISVSGDATGSGTTAISLTLANSGVTAGTYGSTTLVPVVTVDAKGRITNVTTAAISGSLTFTGDVTGSGTTGTSTGLTLAASGVTAGTYTKVTVDTKGRVTVGASATTSDISEGTNLYYTDARVLAYLGANNYATQSYVGTQISNLVAAAPATLDTLNELAAALGNDPSFATTVSTSIGTKVPQTRTLTINGTGYDLSANRSWTINSMVYPSAGIALSTGTAWGTSITDNSANWNTAYGWGNHASAGYLTSATAATTYASLTGAYANPAFVASLAYSKITGVPAFLTSYTETDTLASVTGRGATTTALITVTASEGREVAVYMPASYTTSDLVSGHEYGWYNDHWRLGMTRSGGAAGEDFVIQWNAARKLSLTSGGNLTVTGTISASNFSGTHSGSSSGTNTGDQTNISGTAAYATQWGTSAGYANFSSTAISASVGWLFGTTGNGTYAPVSLASVSSLLGLGSMAYASTGSYAPISHNQAWSTITSTPTTLSGYGISDAVYSTTSSFTTAGTGWYRVATTAGDGRGYYYIEVYTTGGNHNPSYLRIEAMGDWGNDKLIAAYTDLGFPASAVRITRSASTTFIEVNFSTTILGASMRVVRLGFDSTVSVLSGALSAGGNTVQETLSITSKINTASLSINGNAVLHAGNYNSYALPLSGGTVTGTVTINGSASHALAISSSQRYQMQVRNTSNSINSGYGWWWFMDTNFNMGFHADGAADRFTLTRDGNLSVSGTVSGSNLSGTNTGDQTNISGNAATATNVAWTGVSGRPTALSSFTNDLGNYGSWITASSSNTLTNKSGNISQWTNDSGYVTSSNFSVLTGITNYNVDRTTKISNGLAIYSAYSGGSYSPTTYDISAQYVIGGKGMEFAASWHSPSTVMYFRTLRDCCDNWSPWVIMLSALNYTDYTPTKTGGGASGSWGISITGNAATATNVAYSGLTGTVPTWNQNTTGSAGSVAWTNVTSRPTALSSFTNDLGNYGGWITGVTNISGYSGSVSIPDWRNTSYTPDQYAGNNVNWHFNNVSYNNSPPGDFWGAMQTVSPWSVYNDSHRQSQLWWGGSVGLSYRYAVGSGYTVTGWSSWERIITSATISSQPVVTIQDGPPSGTAGRLWWESDTGKLKVYYGSAWVDASPIPDSSLFFAKAGGTITGDVSIGQTLNVVGNTLVQGTIYSFGDVIAYSSSDSRLKDNITAIESPLEKVSKINGVSFNWNDKQTAYEVGKKDIGVIAQEVEEVLPELVTTRDNGYKAVRYEKIVALLIEAIKDQQAQINNLTDKLNNL